MDLIFIFLLLYLNRAIRCVAVFYLKSSCLYNRSTSFLTHPWIKRRHWHASHKWGSKENHFSCSQIQPEVIHTEVPTNFLSRDLLTFTSLRYFTALRNKIHICQRGKFHQHSLLFNGLHRNRMRKMDCDIRFVIIVLSSLDTLVPLCSLHTTYIFAVQPNINWVKVIASWGITAGNPGYVHRIYKSRNHSSAIRHLMSVKPVQCRQEIISLP